MKIFNQKFVREIAQDVYDQRMRTIYINILQVILREAEKGEFSVVFNKEDIPLECIYWLQEKEFEIYTDIGKDDNWFELEPDNFESIFKANRIKVVW